VALVQQTRAQLRRRVADIFGDLRMLEATANGSTTTFVDTFNVNSGTDDYRKCEILFTSSPNAGLVSVVTTSNVSTGTLTFTPARTSTLTGNTAELYRFTGTGFTVAEYHRAINDAIHDLHGTYLIESLQAIALPYSVTDQTLLIPATMHKLYRLEYTTSDGAIREIPPARRAGQMGGWSVEGSGTVRIEGRIARTANGLTLRAWGYTLQSALATDADVCSYDAEAVAYTAAARLCMGRVGSPNTKYASLLLTLEKKAEHARAASATIEHPQTRMVRV
jgi:hypothetical protein